MSTVLIDMPDRIITDTGAMVAKHPLLLALALNGERIDHLPYVAHPDIDRFHRTNGTIKTAKRWSSDTPSEPSLDTFIWSTPEPYSSMDVSELCWDMMKTHDLDQNPAYRDRLIRELDVATTLGMYDFIRCLIWITDTMRIHQVPWGLGRGSSCASLIMFLLGVNKVDPVRYHIPMEEFYK